MDLKKPRSWTSSLALWLPIIVQEQLWSTLELMWLNSRERVTTTHGMSTSCLNLSWSNLSALLAVRSQIKKHLLARTVFIHFTTDSLYVPFFIYVDACTKCENEVLPLLWELLLLCPMTKMFPLKTCQSSSFKLHWTTTECPASLLYNLNTIGYYASFFPNYKFVNTILWPVVERKYKGYCV